MTIYENYQNDVFLTENIEDIMKRDFWICPKLSGEMMSAALQTLKMYASVCIFVKQGSGRASINLEEVQFKAPCIIQIGANQFLGKEEISSDFEASFMVMSERFVDDLLMTISDTRLFSLHNRFPIVPILQEDVQPMERFFEHITSLAANRTNPFLYQSVMHTVAGFFFSIAYKYYLGKSRADKGRSSQRISDKFLHLVEKNFRSHRFLEFYADELGITTKHLSRTIKRQTGKSPVEWIERMTILEAKVELRYTNKSILQIAEDLNFPTQSFFGKYFKKAVGISPKDFRNSHRE